MRSNALWGWFSCCILLILIPLSLYGATVVGGPVEGIWYPEGNPYIVENTIIVLPNTRLQINPGVEVWFSKSDSILVYGTLLAQGLPGDSIKFLDVNKDHWRGIWFAPTSNGGHLEYVLLKNPLWGVRADHSNPIISHATIIAVSACVFGYWSEFTLTNSSLEANGQDVDVIRLYNSDAYISDCRITTSYGYAINYAVGVRIEESNPDVYHSELTLNAMGMACGFWLERAAKPNLYYNLLRITSSNYAFGCYNERSFPSFVNNTVALLSASAAGKGLYLVQNSAPLIENCIIYGDGSSMGVVADAASSPTIRYSDFFNHSINTLNCSLDEGCILEDPLFKDASAGDYSLTANSPCIDAGNPYSPLDPDHTRADMGYLYFEQDTVVYVEPKPTSPLPATAALEIFPNPFNPSGSIMLFLSHSTTGELAIYDVRGRLVEMLADGMLPSGSIRISWKAENVGSGIYWVAFRSENFAQNRKIVLIK
jgi:hypothetical protein